MPGPGSPLTLLLTADCCNGPFPEHQDRDRWTAIYQQAARLQTVLRHASADRARVTWFVRADNQIAATYGDPLACFHEQAPLLTALVQSGDALGFHPHCYRIQQQAWLPDPDPVSEAAMVLAAGRGLGTLPWPVEVARIGEAHMTPYLLAVLRELGLRADCTALPGRHRPDPPVHDWRAAPRQPYRPGDDPAVPAVAAVDGLWEIPFSMLPLQGPHDSAARERYCNLGFRPEHLGPALEAWLPEQDLVVALVHPVETFEAEEPIRQVFPLVAFDLAAPAANLQTILDWAARAGRPVECLTAPGLVDRLEGTA